MILSIDFGAIVDRDELLEAVAPSLLVTLLAGFSGAFDYAAAIKHGGKLVVAPFEGDRPNVGTPAAPLGDRDECRRRGSHRIVGHRMGNRLDRRRARIQLVGGRQSSTRRRIFKDRRPDKSCLCRPCLIGKQARRFLVQIILGRTPPAVSINRHGRCWRGRFPCSATAFLARYQISGRDVRQK